MTRRTTLVSCLATLGLVGVVRVYQRHIDGAARASLRRSEARFRALSEHASDLVQILDVDGAIRYASPSHGSLLGYAPGALLTTNVFGLLHPDDRARAAERFALRVQGRDVPRHLTLRLRHADGSWRIMDVIATNHLDDPAVGGVIVTGRDVTARVRMEETLEASEARFRRMVTTAQEGVVVRDLAGLLTYVNERMAEMLGYRAAEMIGRPLVAFMDEDMRAEAEAGFRRRAGETAERFDVRFRRQDGAPLWAIVSTTPLLDESGAFVESLGMVTDITARKQAADALRASEHDYRELMEHAADGIFLSDRAARFVDVNARGCALLGYDRAELLRLGVADVIDGADLAATPLRLVELGDGRATLGERRMRRKDGALVLVEVSATMLDDGRMQAIVRDITARKRTEEALRASEASLAEAQRLAHVGDWWRDAVTGEAHWSAELCRIHGVAPGKADLGEQLPALTHPEDRATVTAWMGEVLAGTSSRIEHRIVRPDGAVRHVHQRVDVTRNEAGRARRLVGVVQDITPRKVAEEALRASEGLFRAVWEHANDSVVILNPDGSYRYVSPSHVRLLGRTPEEIMGGPPTANMHPDDLAWARLRLAAVLQTPGAADTVEVRMRHRDGSWRWVESVVANHTDDPAVRGAILYSRDITERKRAEEELRHQARYDALTDLPNRAFLHERIAAALGDALPLALLLLDLDHFKEVNDTFGHERGDALLREVADRLRAALRVGDMVARLGGDEFAVLLPGADAAGAAGVAATIRAALDTPLYVEGQALQVGVSVGIALGPAHGADGPTLLRRADVASMWPSARALATLSTSRLRISTAPRAWPSRASCARRSSTARSCCTISRRST